MSRKQALFLDCQNHNNIQKLQQMSKEIKDKEVLMAILNVKKYASNLRKKASNLQDANDETNSNVISSPSFFDTKPRQEYMELNSPLLGAKSSYNQSFTSMTRQKKQHSMTYIPGQKKLDRQLRKNSDFVMPEPTSPAKSYAPSRVNLSQSYKGEADGLKSSNEGAWRKQRKDQSQTMIILQKKPSRKESDPQDDPNFLQLNRTVTLPLNLNRNVSKQATISMTKSNTEDPKLIDELLTEINSLKNEICQYKKALVLIGSKYLELEEKNRFKVQSDHLLDIFRTKIQMLEQQKEQLNQVIKKQNQKIKNFQTTVIQIAGKFSNHYREELNRIVKLEAENRLYKQLLDIRMPNPEKMNIEAIQKETQKKRDKIQDTSMASQTESEGEGYSKPLQIISGRLCKNQKDIQAKYLVQGFPK